MFEIPLEKQFWRDRTFLTFDSAIIKNIFFPNSIAKSTSKSKTLKSL